MTSYGSLNTSRLILPGSRSSVHNDMSSALTNADAFPLLAELTGPAGVGKTVLWQRVRSEIQETNQGLVCSYVKGPQSSGSPYEALSETLEQLSHELGTRRGLPARTILAEAFERDGPHQRVRGLLSRLVPAEVLQARGEPNDVVSNELIVHGLASFLATLAREATFHGVTGIVLTFDDTQWTDPQSEAVLAELCRMEAPIAVVLLGRPSKRTFMEAVSRNIQHHLAPLDRGESHEMARRMADEMSLSDVTESEITWVVNNCGGIPLTVSELLHVIRRTRVLELPLSISSNVEDTARFRLERLSPAARAIVEWTSLLLPPVRLSTLMRVPDMKTDRLLQCIDEAVEVGLLAPVTADQKVSFVHDRLESAIRQIAMTDNRKTHAATTILSGSAASGDLRAAYALARATVAPESELPRAHSFRPPAGQLGDRRTLSIGLASAAERAIELRVPLEALAFARSSFSIGGADLTPRARARVASVGHEAAFLLDDARAMSSWYRVLVETGDRVAVAKARLHWLQRSYAHLMIDGAFSIGWNTLGELGERVVRPGHLKRNSRILRVLLALIPPELVYLLIREPRSRGRPEGPVSTNICLALLPVLGSVYTNRFAVLAWIVLKNSVLHGLSTASAQGFILWSFATLPYRKGHRFHARLTRLARFCATRSEAHGVSRAGRLLVRSYLEIALDYWGSSIRRTNAKLRSFQREATALGAFEVDAQARTLYCQNLLYAGVPLAEVKRTFRNERRHVEAIGHSRVAASMKKYHQAVECLQGSCPDPLELTGSVTNEAEVLRGLEESRDRLGLEGFYSLKTMVALYNAQPSAALAACREWPPTPTTAKWIMSSLINEYHRALAAWQCGAVREARAATAVLAEIHGARLGRHRLPAARAERSRFLGRLRAARRAYRSAVDRALADGFPHEAAYLCERLADLPGARVNIGSRTRAEKERMLSTAYMLYSEWGARPAVERVRRKLADLRTARGAPADRAGAAAATVEPGQLVAEDGGADRRLSRMQHNLRLLVTSINDALLLLDYDGRLLFCNPAAEQYLAETDDTGVNGAAGEEALQPEIAEVVQELVSQPLQVGQVLTRDCSWRGRVLRVVLSPGMGAEGAPVAAATIADITESRQREQQLAVADRMASIGLLTATVAHEVANPNHVVQLNLQSMELLLDRGLEIAPSDSSVADTLYELRSALAGVRDGSRRIDDVVSLVKSHGRAADEDTPQSGSPAEVADHVARFTRFLTRANQVEFRLEVEDRLPNIELYGSTLEQALINLVKNACEATTGDRRIVVLRVRAATIEDGTAVRFEVCDTGSGIPEALARAVATDSLTPYAKTSTKAGGTGLGLSIVQSIVRRHRGLFSYRSEPDFSTVAEIVVPAAR